MSIILSGLASFLLRMSNVRSSSGSGQVEDGQSDDISDGKVFFNKEETFGIELKFSTDVGDDTIAGFTEAAKGLVALIDNPPPELIDYQLDKIRVTVAPSENLYADAFTYVDEWDKSGKVPISSTIVYDEKSFDKADPEIIYKLALHELLHSIGFGTSWANFGFVTQDENENLFLDGLSGFGHTPLSEDGLHWAEAEYGSEIGTPIINDDAYLGEITLSALEQIGYEISDDYVHEDDLTEDDLLF